MLMFARPETDRARPSEPDELSWIDAVPVAGRVRLRADVVLKTTDALAASPRMTREDASAVN